MFWFLFASSFVTFLPVHFHKGVGGSYVHFRPRPRQSSCRWATLATHRHSGPHTECGPCTHAHFGCATTARVSPPKRRGSLHGLAHAARHGHFPGASTSGRSVPFDAVHVRKPRSKKLAIISPETWLSFVRHMAQNHAHVHMQTLGRNNRLVCQGWI